MANLTTTSMADNLTTLSSNLTMTTDGLTTSEVTTMIASALTTMTSAVQTTTQEVTTTVASDLPDWMAWFQPAYDWMMADKKANLANYVIIPLFCFVYIGAALVYVIGLILFELRFVIKAWKRKNAGLPPPKKKKKKKLNFLQKRKLKEKEEREKKQAEYLKTLEDERNRLAELALKLKQNKRKRVDQAHVEGCLKKYFSAFSKPYDEMESRPRSNSWSHPSQKDTPVSIAKLKEPIMPKPKPKPKPIRPESAIDQDAFNMRSAFRSASKRRDKEVKLGLRPPSAAGRNSRMSARSRAGARPQDNRRKPDPALASILEEHPLPLALTKNYRRKVADTVIPEDIEIKIKKAFDNKPPPAEHPLQSQATVHDPKQDKLKAKLEAIKKKRQERKEAERWQNRRNITDKMNP
ncbi:uncharacterized protein LOC106175227 [Lingula anatina]|uniref:Uncharacterized protein LOC106175227 n=1 Tax=Lingula anatina TaxID=7574 RepID=A0A1S3JRH3_LINAN|nr:uncharacterized protein LOC106175227 [Lingula anatina]|eukprot:XP_013412579.1 uncharacterized protein LOC106175227 [Lingula anatina]